MKICFLKNSQFTNWVRWRFKCKDVIFAWGNFKVVKNENMDVAGYTGTGDKLFWLIKGSVSGLNEIM